MSLRQLAAADLVAIHEDTAGFGWPLRVTNPDGITASITGISSDVSAAINPETGQIVSGRQVHVSMVIATLESLGLGMPRGTSDKSAKPWLVVFDDINGREGVFKVAEALPDRALGSVVCILEAYKRG